MIVSAAQMKKIEDAAMDAGATAESLMDQAAEKIANAVRQFFPNPGTARIFYGKGHNGGDALAAARILSARGWRIILHAGFANGDLAPLTQKKLSAVAAFASANGDRFGSPLIVLDGLLGIGARGALRDPIRAATREINRLRTENNAHVFAIDLPTGLADETGEPDPDCVCADFTLAVGFAKKALVADCAINHVGRIAVLSLPDFQKFANGEPAYDPHSSIIAAPETLAPLLPRRPFDFHKGKAGRVGIIAGSIGFSGAAVMSAQAAVRAGAGLVTLYVTRDIFPIVAAKISSEIMVQPVNHYREICDANHDVLAIGPGLGQSRRNEILDLIVRWNRPMVADADALNALATQPELLRQCAGARLLTPHPGEMARLFSTEIKDRIQIAKAFVREFPVTLLFKGARTIVAENGRPASCNTTGNPGMATGGMGDILTGVCAALIGQGLSLFDAARLGAWLCGRAAEIAISENGGNRESEESLTAPDLLSRFGRAFRDLRAGAF